MSNKPYAKEWLIFANKNLETAILLFEANHEDRYPNPNYSLPPREEIKELLDFTQKLFDKVCKILDINKEELKHA